MRRLMALVVFAVGCKKAPPPQFSEQDLAANRATLEKNIAEKPSCARPVLHAGSAATVDLSSRFKLPAVCDDLKKAIDAEAAKGPMAELPFDVLDAPKANECLSTVATFVHDAVSADAVCASPYDEPEAGEQFKPQFIAYIIALQARTLAKTSPAEGLTLAMDGVRFFQDGTRGGTLMQAMLSVAARDLVIDRGALPIVTAKPELTDATCAAVSGDVDALLATEPPLHDILVAEANWIGTEHGLKHLTGKERDDGAAALAASVANHTAWGTACPVGASVNACRTALEQPSAAPQTKGNDTLDRAGGLPPYVAKWGEPIVRLAVLRFTLEVKEHGCPQAATEQPWASILAPAALGDSLRADKTSTGFTLRAPAWMDKPGDEWPISCPAPT
jgi:hypothetical protein